MHYYPLCFINSMNYQKIQNEQLSLRSLLMTAGPTVNSRVRRVPNNPYKAAQSLVHRQGRSSR